MMPYDSDLEEPLSDEQVPAASAHQMVVLPDGSVGWVWVSLVPNGTVIDLTDE